MPRLLRDLGNAALLAEEAACDSRIRGLLQEKIGRHADYAAERRWSNRHFKLLRVLIGLGFGIAGLATGAPWTLPTILFAGGGFGWSVIETVLFGYETWKGSYLKHAIDRLDFHIEQIRLYRQQIRFILSLRADGRLPNDVPDFPVRSLELE